MVSNLDRERSVAYDVMAYAMQKHSDSLGILDILGIGGASVSTDHLKHAFNHICYNVRTGGTISEGMIQIKNMEARSGFDIFYDWEIEAVGVGENSGETDVAFKGLAEKLKSGIW